VTEALCGVLCLDTSTSDPIHNIVEKPVDNYVYKNVKPAVVATVEQIA
jgi:hypothetical protein